MPRKRLKIRYRTGQAGKKQAPASADGRLFRRLGVPAACPDPRLNRNRSEVVAPLNKRRGFMLGTILIIVLILLLIGALPTWGHSRSWGYAPSGLLGVVAIIVIILLVMGRI
jgi:hypothetical protein